MTEPSLEEMMRYMNEGKIQMLYLSLIIYSLLFGITCLIILRKYFVPDSYTIFPKAILALCIVGYLFFVSYRLYTYKYGKNQSPWGGGIYLAYYECIKCKSLHGGIYGKGPTKSVIFDKKSIHKWKALEKRSLMLNMI
ncbi:hypothetical protein AAG747_04675 [Rapidithrix thailandica]|uniref:Uncharacterized protein n=1 Tax=Rapidithrix thailandica TaxID=413964 RepID=A0AAW9S489_9BACT